MNDLVQDELRHVLTDWKQGREIPSIVLGHSVREVERDGQRTQEHHVFRQKKVHDLVFLLIEACLVDAPAIDFDQFDAITQERSEGLSAEERDAAKSLAWVALRRGWKRAISGFPDAHAISLKREAEA